jgi:predicted phage terminase large subunit-like protein
LQRVNSWSEAEDEYLESLLKEEYDGEGLEAYIRRKSPRLPPQRHMMPIIAALEEARDASRDPHSAIRIILIEMPPRHGKTTTVMHGLEWRVTRDPAVTNAYMTYGDDLARSKSRVMRSHVSAEVALDPAMANLAEWRTPEGGGVLCGGIMGPLTGKGINGFLVVDDPIRNRRDAESETVRQTIWEQFTDVVYTRLEGAATVVVMMTRWHPDDLIGRILSKRAEIEEQLGDQVQITRIRLPALAENDDPMGRAVGEPLWPERYNARRLTAIQTMLGDYSFAAMYQQAPRQRGTILFSAEPARFQLHPRLPNGMPDYGRILWEPRGHRLLIGADPAASETTKSDNTAAYVMAAMGFAADMELWILDGFSHHLTIPAAVRALQGLRARWYNIPIAVEAVAGFKAVPQLLHEVDPTLPVIPVVPLGDKWMRAQFVASLWNRGRVHVPIDAPWAANLIHRARSFTGAERGKDDEIDALSTGANELSLATGRQRPDDAVINPYSPYG